MRYLCKKRRFNMENPTNSKKKKAIDQNTGIARDYGNDPYFVKKAKKSKAFLEKNGFPKELERQHKSV